MNLNVTDIFKKTSFYCLNHDSPAWVPLVLIKNTEKIQSPFYACACYPHDEGSADMPVAKKPEGMNDEDTMKWEARQKEKAEYLAKQPVCYNRISADDLTNLTLKFIGIVGESPMTDFTNYSFYFKGPKHKYEARILKYANDDIRIGILNMTVGGVA